MSSAREVVLDVETTGLSFDQDRIIEIGIVELFDRTQTGNVLQYYFNPQVAVSEEALAIHGLSNEMLSDKPTIRHHLQEIIDFVADSTIVAHSASFDMGMLNAELARNGFAPLKNRLVDTLAIARLKFKGIASLDALCKRFKISNRDRKLHGALKDAKLLALVYYFLSEFTQVSSDEDHLSSLQIATEVEEYYSLPQRANPSMITETEKQAHIETMAFCKTK